MKDCCNPLFAPRFAANIYKSDSLFLSKEKPTNGPEDIEKNKSKQSKEKTNPLFASLFEKGFDTGLRSTAEYECGFSIKRKKPLLDRSP